jgi:hypothetical protein
VIDHGLEQQRHAQHLAERVSAERNHLDGVPLPPRYAELPHNGN